MSFYKTTKAYWLHATFDRGPGRHLVFFSMLTSALAFSAFGLYQNATTVTGTTFANTCSELEHQTLDPGKNALFVALDCGFITEMKAGFLEAIIAMLAEAPVD